MKNRIPGNIKRYLEIGHCQNDRKEPAHDMQYHVPVFYKDKITERNR